MTSNAAPGVVTVTRAAAAHKPALAHLMQLYLHDLSEFDDDDVRADGTFSNAYLDLYWQEPGRHPFRILCDGAWAGFALVRDLPEGVHEMAEFFILRKFRRAGVGATAATHLFRHFGGGWHVAQEADNHPAQAFWRRVIGDVTGGRFEDTWSDARPSGPMQIFELG